MHQSMAVGNHLETVLIGQPIGGHIVIWHGSGSRSYWSLGEQAVLVALLGRGAVARTQIESGRFREAGLLNAPANALLVPGRHPDADGTVSLLAEVALEPADAGVALQAARAEDPSGWARSVGEYALEAATRGEFMAIESGGYDVPLQPYVLMIAARNDDDYWYSVIETAPAPQGAPVWSDQPISAEGTQSLSAPATTETFSAAGELAYLAAATWGLDRLDLGLSFGPNPHGLWRSEPQ